jgi:4-aminobutyrate aminotransferase-like enzyme/Ser/Thr protein kinase RdoA (MazF antagonist)
MQDINAASRAGLSRPDIGPDDAAAILQEHYGLSGDISELGSQQDRNFRIDTGNGRSVLKICRVEYGHAELEAQNEAMKHLAASNCGVLVPVVFRSLSGEEILSLELRGQTCLFRLLGYIEGEPLTRRRHLSEKSVAALGDIAGRVAKGLTDFVHPGLDRHIQWDLSRANQIVGSLLAGIDGLHAVRINDAMAAAERRLEPLRSRLRIQPIHHDITDDNVVSSPDDACRPIPFGVIDFGDVMKGWLVADLASTCASLLHHAGGDPFYILPAVKAFHAIYPLTREEMSALWPLIVERAAILVASSEHQLSVEPDNAYVLGNIDHEREIFETALSVPCAVMEEAILDAIGIASGPRASLAAGRLLTDIDPATISVIRFDTLSPHLSDENWTSPDIEARLFERAAFGRPILARYGEFRLTRTVTHMSVPPDSFALHIAIRLPERAGISAPFAGVCNRDGEIVRLVGEGQTLFLTGLETASPQDFEVEAGTRIGEAVPGGLITIQLCLAPDLRPPLFARPHHANAWARLCPSPSNLLDGDFDAPAPKTAELMAVRKTHFAKPQKNYYENPPQIERGWKDQLFDVTGRAFLDMVNNVTILGHGHPRIAEAAGKQWALLNTNSRFHYAGVADYSARLAALAPDGLDTVFLVNSGSEANDLALRLAWAHSGQRNVVSLLEAYHGWTVASDAVSTSIADNPQALSTRPSWVHPVTSPNTYRGPFRGPESAADYVDAVRKALTRIEEKGEGIGGFICEAVYGNSGGIPLPKGYLTEVYRLVREHGGVTIADEVQVGFGRLGHYFWGFEEQGVVPDIITVAKGMGNGQPLGAVITTRAIADSLEKEGYFFSSAGGSPVSCAVGMTVLDIMRDEKLQDNARDTGNYLKSRLEALGQRFPLVGAVHGMGLYLGLEFVRNRETLEPATAETAAICDRLLDLGVIMQPTGDHLNVLKIKPPLCLSRKSADFFADVLAKVLDEGW